MAGLVPVRRRHKHQPKGPQTVNWALPITAGLELAVIAPNSSAPEIAFGRTVNTATGTIASGVTEWGEGLKFASESTKSVSYNVPVFDKPYTCVIGYKLETLPTSNRTLCGTFVNNTSGFRIAPGTANFLAQFGRAGATQQLTGSAITVGNKIDAVVVDASNFYYYENGSLSVSAAQSGYAPGSQIFALGQGGSGVTPPISTIAFCYYFSRALSAEEIKKLYDQPYHFLTPTIELLEVTKTHGFGAALNGQGAALTGGFTHTDADHLLSGSIAGQGAHVTGSFTHFTVVNHNITGALAVNTPVVTGQLSHYTFVAHNITGALVGSGPQATAAIDHGVDLPHVVTLVTIGGDGNPVTKIPRRQTANEELDKLFDDIIREYLGLDDVAALEAAIERLPINFDVDLETLTRIEEIKYLIAAYEQYLDDEKAAEILLIG